MSTVFIMLVVVFQLNGPVKQMAISAPDLEACRATAPAIIVEAEKDFPNSVVQAVCIQVDKPHEA